MNTKIKVISTCKRTRNSTWANGQPRRTTKGMKMVVEHTKGPKGKLQSVTKYI